MTKFTEACGLLNEIEREAPQLSKQTKELRGLMLMMPLQPNKQKKGKLSLHLLLKIFVGINVLPIIVMPNLMVWGLDGITHAQWGGAWMTLVLGVVGIFAHEFIVKENK